MKHFRHVLSQQLAVFDHLISRGEDVADVGSMGGVDDSRIDASARICAWVVIEVDHDHIGALSDFKAPDLVVDSEDPRSISRGEA